MNCQQCSENIDQVIDRECSEEVRSAVTKHIESCTSCQQIWHKRQLLKDQMSVLSKSNSMDPRLPAKIILSLERAERRQALSKTMFFAGVAASIALIVFLLKPTPVAQTPTNSTLAALDLSQIADRYQAHVSPDSPHHSDIEEHLVPVDLKALSNKAGFVVSTRQIIGFKPAAAEIINGTGDRQAVVHFCYQPQNKYKVCIDCYQSNRAQISLVGVNSADLNKTEKTRDERYTMLSGTIKGNSFVVLNGADHQVFISKLPAKLLIQLIGGQQDISFVNPPKFQNFQNSLGINGNSKRIQL
ncbi:MAG: zf-HC2 domain-containing protein [Candidatus Obscuribacter sp.]|jgi:hypothetical protein|nr:zf-HC2 domain-containing protein [Candidatus Obscuribacter sp.]MDQ5967779.1 Zf-HC2 protein [Cyanobacteriota bacterium erpe_2018_sw_39hr_WHONDRS-SW48-000098_B_bin.30]MBK9202313.1 zf-HC2 domain-containing protein [Candidatus Obscuribacter sp.]MBK9618909.1 zf-HC2 domain-containing protein [Candidatus Obscuribacter sp.]MBK9769694.1 zf-HC2 domain-containing protein [Candidatus Obscuribacter sp.]